MNLNETILFSPNVNIEVQSVAVLRGKSESHVFEMRSSCNKSSMSTGRISEVIQSFYMGNVLGMAGDLEM